MKKDKHIETVSLDRIAIVHAAQRASDSVASKAHNSGIPVMYEEDGAIYRSFDDGSTELVKRIPKAQVAVPKTFTLG